MIQSFVDILMSSFAQVVLWVYQFFVYFIWLLLHDLFVVLGVVFDALIMIANSIISLMPACNAPSIDLPSALSNAGVALSSLNWVLPIGTLATVAACLVQAVMAYFVISWIFRWLKIIA